MTNEEWRAGKTVASDEQPRSNEEDSFRVTWKSSPLFVGFRARRPSPLYSRGNTRRVDGERIIENHLELPAGIKKHNRAASVVNKYQGNRDPGCGGCDPYPYGSSNM